MEQKKWEALVLQLKSIAERKGISHMQIATRSGLQKSSVTRVFGLKFKCTLETFMKIAAALDVNILVDDQEEAK